MQILVIAATENEIPIDKLRKIGIEVLVTGVGVPATIYHLQKRLQRDKPGLVIQAGIAGGFGLDGLGEVVLIKQDAFADLGMEEQEVFSPIFQTGFANKDSFPFSDGWLVNSNPLLDNYPLRSVAGITVNKVSDSLLQRRQMVDCFTPAIETMEGAALHFVCLMGKVNFLQVRSISNFVGERDKRKWKFPEAIASLSEELYRLVVEINEP